MEVTQSLESIDKKLYRLLRYKRNIKDIKIASSLSGIFKALRKDSRISNIGDYPILSYTLRKCSEKFPGHKWSKAQMYRAFKFCRFWEEEGKKEAYIPKEWNLYVKND